jgi:hypothetical protein
MIIASKAQYVTMVFAALFILQKDPKLAEAELLAAWLLHVEANRSLCSRKRSRQPSQQAVLSAQFILQKHPNARSSQ